MCYILYAISMKITCNALNKKREIPVEDCKPNPDHPDCKVCDSPNNRSTQEEPPKLQIDLLQKEQPETDALEALPPVPDSLRKRCPLLPKRCPIYRKYGSDDAMYIINWGADFKSIDNKDVRDVAYAMCLSWWDRPVYNSVYNGMLAIDRKKESTLYRYKAEFFERYCNMGADELMDVTKPLALYVIHWFEDYRGFVEFLDLLAGEINEYSVLHRLWQSLHNRYPRLKNEPPLENKLRSKLFRQVQDLIKEQFPYTSQRRNYSEVAAFILAKCGIIDSECAYRKERCNRTDCIKQRFKELPQSGNIKPIECFKIFSKLKVSDSLETAKPVKERLEQCNDCMYRKKNCPAYFPCPTGKEAYKKELQRKKYKGCTVEAFLEECDAYYGSEKCKDYDSCNANCYLEELREWQFEMNRYVTDERYDPIQN